MSDEPRAEASWRRGDWLAAGALVLMLAPLLLRATMPIGLLPGWELDPLVIASGGMYGIGPGASMLVDAVVLVGAGLGLMAGRGGIGRWTLALLLMGGVAVVAHGWGGAGGSLHDQRIGLAWLSAMAAGLSLHRLAGDRRWRAVCAGVLVGLIGLLAVRAAVQVLVEHPATVAEFRATREQVLAAQGWAPDSAMARAYERRLMQSDASAWFGLSNVLAGFSAAMVVASGGLLLAAWRGGTQVVRLGLGLAVVASLAALMAAQSKGGFGALLAGVGAAAVLWWRARGERARAAGWVGPGLVVLVLLAIAGRGLVGERVGELSILFRWFYTTAAAQIAAEHALMGVGPDGFKDAFLLVKNPLCPEEVASPHSVLFDWWACLGVAGLGWAVIWFGWLGAAGRVTATPMEPREEHPAGEARRLVRLAAAIAVIATLGVVAFEGASSDTMALVRMVGLALWGWIAGAAAWTVYVSAGDAPGERWVRLGLSGAALTIAAHAQIDVAASWPQSAGLVMALIAVAGSGSHGGRATTRRGVDGRWVGFSLLPLAGVAAWGGVQGLTWERALVRAAEPAAVFRAVNEMLNGTTSRADAERLAQVDPAWAKGLTLLSEPAVRSATTSAEAIRGIRVGLLRRAADGLVEAEARSPGLLGVTREISRLNLIAAELSPEGSAEREGGLVEATQWAMRPGASAAALSWESQIHERAAALSGNPEALEPALDAALRTWSLDPTNPMHGVRVTRLGERLVASGRGAGIADRLPQLARRTLELNELGRLDRAVRGLSESEIGRLERLARGSGG
jgi:hypothetical protein